MDGRELKDKGRPLMLRQAFWAIDRSFAVVENWLLVLTVSAALWVALINIIPRKSTGYLNSAWSDEAVPCIEPRTLSGAAALHWSAKIVATFTLTDFVRHAVSSANIFVRESP